MNPSGRTPLSVPRDPGGQPWTYLQPPLGQAGSVSTVDPTPLYAFGHGLSYTTFAWDDFKVGPHGELSTDDGDGATFTVELTVTNVGDSAGSDVVQLYLRDPVAQVTRPTARIIGFAKLALDPGESRRLRFTGHVDLTAFTGRSGHRIVEPGDIELRLATSSAPEAIRHRATLKLVSDVRPLASSSSRLVCDVEIS